MNKVNYQNISDEIISKIAKQGRVPSLLLHSCCAPCSSYVLEYLSRYFSITVFFFNPNISPEQEFVKRAEEEIRLVKSMTFKNPVKVVVGEYDSDSFEKIAEGLENTPEGGERCGKCYRLRLEKTARFAKEKGFDFFTTTLSISPLKNSQVLNKIGKEISENIGVDYFFSDFKKKEGYKRSIELSNQWGLYRQNYCGCVYSKKEAERREATK